MTLAKNTMIPLINKHCRDYSSTEPALNLSKIESFRSQVSDWQYCASDNVLTRNFYFKDYEQTISFVNRVANIAQQENHHPHLSVTYNRCIVCYNTHTVNGNTENDFICAAKINQIINA